MQDAKSGLSANFNYNFSITCFTPNHKQSKNEKAAFEHLIDIGQFRYRLWQHTDMAMSGPVENTWLEPEDLTSYIWQIKDHDKIVATARMSIHDSLASLPEAALYEGLDALYPTPIASFNRLVVANEYRSIGLAHKLIMLRVQAAKQLGAKSIALDCPEHRINTMKKFGFEAVSKPKAGTKCPTIMWYPLRKLL
ncbi:GNAT family N-acetyltransferase [Algibacillus agarilyticus]|uniref:GNAT family N-acetyltransferase n=1 Tax=Algibacillus agarilyticus TaxID=2234133 RepID=UPI000DD01D0B|nr:GNAT family N-acetyltransferase [Algibacillus agarilyticus]